MPPSRNGKSPQPVQDNYWKTPRIIETMHLSPHAYRLYGHLKSVAGEDGFCWETTRTLAAACDLSTGYISLAKHELVDQGLILITKKVRTTAPQDYIKIVGVWHENHAMWHQESFQDGLISTQEEGKTVPQVERSPETVQKTVQTKAKDRSNPVADEQDLRNKIKEQEPPPLIPPTGLISLGHFAKGFQALRDIPKYLPNQKRDASLVQFLEGNEITPDVFFRAATALAAAWPPRTSKNPDPWLSVRTYCLNRVKWDAERASAPGPPGNGHYQRPMNLHERRIEMERGTPPLRQPRRPGVKETENATPGVRGS